MAQSHNRLNITKCFLRQSQINECGYALNVKMILTISTKIENSSHVAHPQSLYVTYLAILSTVWLSLREFVY